MGNFCGPTAPTRGSYHPHHPSPYADPRSHAYLPCKIYSFLHLQYSHHHHYSPKSKTKMQETKLEFCATVDLHAPIVCATVDSCAPVGYATMDSCVPIVVCSHVVATYYSRKRIPEPIFTPQNQGILRSKEYLKSQGNTGKRIKTFKDHPLRYMYLRSRRILGVGFEPKDNLSHTNYESSHFSVPSFRQNNSEVQGLTTVLPQSKGPNNLRRLAPMTH